MATDATKDAEATAKAEPDAGTTTELLTGTVGDRCAKCQAPMAADQRYCVNCGERRGTPRFSPAASVAPAASAPAAQPVRAAPRSRVPSGATLVAGVATLLIAMGVGVLIGHDSNSSSPSHASQPVQIVTVGGGSAASTTSSTPSTGASAPAGGHTGTYSHKAASAAAKGKVPSVHVTAKSQAAASQAAKSVLGGSAPKNPTQSVGSSCSAGTAGCQNGKFTGNFFGGQ